MDDLPCAIHRSVIPQIVARRVPTLSGANLFGANGFDLDGFGLGTNESESDDYGLRDPSFSLYKALVSAGFQIDKGTECLRSRLASEKEAQLLQMPERDAVMVVLRKSYDHHGQLLESVEAVYKGDAYVCELKLKKALGMPEHKPSTIGG